MNRPYDLIVYGATGYLGSLVVQYLWAHAPPAIDCTESAWTKCDICVKTVM